VVPAQAQCNENWRRAHELTLTLFKLALAAGKVAHTSAGQSGVITGLLCATPRVTFKWVHVFKLFKMVSDEKVSLKVAGLGALYNNGIEILALKD
jgi:hypothetical protein